MGENKEGSIEDLTTHGKDLKKQVDKGTFLVHSYKNKEMFTLYYESK
tara:strand:+ start:34134 stop:34274 length:141 start_codon:yes stop_codon:yes gene_type:complete